MRFNSEPQKEGAKVPEVKTLQCDNPGCQSVGDYVTIVADGVSTDIILCPDHRQGLDEIASWGRRGRRSKRPTTTRRSTESHRLDKLLDADSN